MMHEIIVHVIRAKPSELLIEIAVERSAAADQILRKLCGDADAVADPVPLHNLAERRFAARIDVRGIEVVHARRDRLHDLALGLRKVDAPSLLRKPHAAESEDRKRLSVFILSVLHGALLPTVLASVSFEAIIYHNTHAVKSRISLMTERCFFDDRERFI
mgnify:CR=1 FL=1